MNGKLCLIAMIGLSLFNMSQTKAQVNLKGTVSDQDGKRLKGVMVALINNQDIILSFANTDSLGHYVLNYNNASKKDSFFVQINELGFVKIKQVVSESNRVIDIKLIPEYQQIQNVTVYASKPLIIQKSDTIRYNVDSFSTRQDRTILDVIKKLPGIDVSESGEIKFQGKSINALYVDGDNLVDGKYNALTKSLPNDIAASIEVLRNHQPIQTLQGIQFSDAPGLNIVLKDKSRMKMIIDGGAGIGIPKLYEAKLNAMTFKKSFKMLSSFNALNTGKDLKQDLISHFRSDPDFRNDKDLLNSELALAPLSPNRILLNKDLLEDMNMLLKTKNNLDIRLNISYYNRVLTNEKKTEQYFILPLDTISYTESMSTRYRESVVKIGFNTLLNKKSTYFNNNFSLERQSTGAESNMFASSTGKFNESYSSKKLLITNAGRYIKVLTPKHILEAYSFLFYKKIPQENNLVPGLYNAALNSNQPYDALRQEGETQGFSTRNYVTIRFPGTITHAVKLGIDIVDQKLTSNLDKIIAGVKTQIADSFTNNVAWYRTRLYSEYTINKNVGNTNFEWSLPIEKNWITYNDSLLRTQHQYTFIQPSVKIRSKLGKMGTMNFNAAANQTIGSYYDIYKGYLLNGYRSFTSKGGILPVLKNNTASLSYEMNNVPRFLFITTALGINHVRSNVLPVFMLSELSTAIVNRELSNETLGYSYTFSIAKYVRTIKTLLSVQPSFIRNQFNQLQNGYLLSYLNNTWNWNIKTASKLSSFLNVNYSAILTTFINKPKNETVNSFTQRTSTVIHKTDINVSLHPTLMLSAMGEFYRNTRAGNKQLNAIEFVDIVLDYKPEKSKIECRLSMMNILDKQLYTTIGSSSNAYNQSIYTIRPRNIMLHLNYRF